MKKKVVFIINNFLVGGVERFSRDLWPHWDHSQVDLSVISVWGSGRLVGSYKELGIPVYWAGGKLAYDSKNPLLKLYFSIIAPLTWCRLVWFLCRLKPVAVLTCLTQADILGISAAWACRIPIRIIRQADVKRISPVVKWVKQKLAVNLATSVIANSAPTGKFMQTYFGASSQKVLVIPNGIDLAKFTQIATQSVRADQPVVGFLGRLESIKGIQYFVSAIQLLKTKYNLMPSVVIFGDGSLREEWESYARDQQLTNVSWRGEVLRPELALPDIDILVMPSESEGFGFVLLEGLAAGRIMVASDLEVFHALVAPESNGYYFPTGDAGALAAVLARLVRDPELLKVTQVRVRAWLQTEGQKYDLAAVAQKYQEVLLSSAADPRV